MKGEIIERGDKVFQLRIYLGRDENRKKQYHIETFKGGRRAAENRLSELVTKFNKGELASQSTLTLADYFTIWKRDALDGSVTKRTANHYEFLIKKHLTPALGKTRLAKLTPLEVQRYYSTLREKGYSGKTIRHIHGVLSKALSQAVNWGILNANPAKQVALPKRVKKEMKSFTSDQAIAFLEAAKEDRYAAMWFLAIDSGMRP